MEKQEALDHINVSLGVAKDKARRNVLTSATAAFELGRISMCQQAGRDDEVHIAAVSASTEIYRLLSQANEAAK